MSCSCQEVVQQIRQIHQDLQSAGSSRADEDAHLHIMSLGRMTMYKYSN